MYQGPQTQCHNRFVCPSGKEFKFDPQDPASRRRAQNAIDKHQHDLAIIVAERVGKSPTDLTFRDWQTGTGQVAPVKELTTREQLDASLKESVAKQNEQLKANPYASRLEELQAERKKHDLFASASDPKVRAQLDRQILGLQTHSETWEDEATEKRQCKAAIAKPDVRQHLKEAEQELERAISAPAAPTEAISLYRSAKDELAKTGNVSDFLDSKVNYFETCIEHRNQLRQEEAERRSEFEAKEASVLGSKADDVERFVQDAKLDREKAIAVESEAAE